VVVYQTDSLFAELKIQVLEERLRLVRIAKYGAGAEKLPAAQLELLESEPGVSRVEVEAESRREPVDATTRQNRPQRRHPGRQKLSAHLPRVERVLGCTPEQCGCAGCGRAKTVIGYEESEQLEVEPARYFVVVSKREKRACRRCDEQGVATAPLPPRIIEKGLVSNRVVIDTVVSKYCEHVPLYRQSAMLGAGHGAGVDPGHAGRLGAAGGRVVAAGCGRHAAGADWRQLSPSRRDSGGCADARWLGEESSGLSMAIQQARRSGGVRLVSGPGPGWTQAVSGIVCRDFAK
jgi:transposase